MGKDKEQRCYRIFCTVFKKFDVYVKKLTYINRFYFSLKLKNIQVNSCFNTVNLLSLLINQNRSLIEIK